MIQPIFRGEKSLNQFCRKIDGVNSATINFLTQKLTLDAEDDRLEAILDEAERIIRKIEPDCTLEG